MFVCVCVCAPIAEDFKIGRNEVIPYAFQQRELLISHSFWVPPRILSLSFSLYLSFFLFIYVCVMGKCVRGKKNWETRGKKDKIYVRKFQSVLFHIHTHIHTHRHAENMALIVCQSILFYNLRENEKMRLMVDKHFR